MAFNYRVLKKELSNGEHTYDVCEVYYDDKGIPNSWAWKHNVLSGDSLTGLAATNLMIQVAFEKPVLEVVVNGEHESLRETDEMLGGPLKEVDLQE